MEDRSFEIEIDGLESVQLHTADVEDMDLVQNPDGSYHLLLDSRAFQVEILEIKAQGKEYHLKVDGHLLVARVNDPLDQLINQMGLSNISQASVSEVYAPMPGLVLDVDISVGQEVEEGQTLLILEAMKMENVIKAPVKATIAEIAVQSGSAIEKGQLLVRFE
ncbi:MAG: acetyl-CoA carboxylase biotin carboxyl carrier protein subunit [Saprospiraceae bacterium]|nr:acetyl-CoA carboxylase biotin carboxyl carrier protein subunit [Saprospiraceae bacterium]